MKFLLQKVIQEQLQIANVEILILMEQVKRIAETKMVDLNTKNIDQAVKIIEGTARQMGVEVVK